MSLNFLKKNPSQNTPNYLAIEPLSGVSFIFKLHPFIESFKHTIEPKVQQQEVGLFAVPTYYKNGVSGERYDVTFALPAIDEKHAKSNYEQVARLKDFVNPTITELINQTGLLKLTMDPLIKSGLPVYGYLTSVDEQIDLEPGFLDGYPKLIRVSLSFAVDKVYEEVYGDDSGVTRDPIPAEADIAAGAPPPSTLADQAKFAAAGLRGRR